MTGHASRRPIVILISGRGSNMRALIERSHDSGAAYSVSQVFSDQPAAAGLETARELGVPCLALPADKTLDRTTYDRGLAAAIAGCSPALIVLAGFMRILSAEFVQEFAGRIFNIHPSLLPKYPGRHTHRRALEARDTLHGATVHFVTERLDGGPPILQARLAVCAHEDEKALAARVQALEHCIYPLAVQWFCEGRLHYEAEQAWFDGRPLREPVQYSTL